MLLERARGDSTCRPLKAGMHSADRCSRSCSIHQTLHTVQPLPHNIPLNTKRSDDCCCKLLYLLFFFSVICPPTHPLPPFCCCCFVLCVCVGGGGGSNRFMTTELTLVLPSKHTNSYYYVNCYGPYTTRVHNFGVSPFYVSNRSIHEGSSLHETYACAPPHTCTFTYARTHAHARARARAHTHTHTHTH